MVNLYQLLQIMNFPIDIWIDFPLLDDEGLQVVKEKFKNDPSYKSNLVKTYNYNT